MQVSAAGDRGLLVTLPGASSARLGTAAERVRTLDGVLGAIVGHESVYVIGSGDAEAVRRAIEQSADVQAAAIKGHVIEVSFASEYALDLDQFLGAMNISRDVFLRRVPAISLSVRYLGFRGGFGYLDGWPMEWAVPRRPTSRNHVPRGSFGIAAAMAGFYPVDSPGGWNILGRTAAPLWDPMREPPNLFAPGDHISLVPTLDAISSPLPGSRGAVAPRGTTIAEVIAPGQLTTIVGAPDWHRVEHGVPPGGAFDEDAAAMANEAARNSVGAPLLECVLVGPRLRFSSARRVAWCGPDLEVRTWRASADQEIDIGRFSGGLRGYLSIEGGIDEMRPRYAEEPRIVKRDDALSQWSAGNLAGARRRDRLRHRGDRLMIRIVPGPHDAPPLPEEWEVTPQLNRVGIRLRSQHNVEMNLPRDLPSCGMQFGTLQWHPDGSVVAMGPDHPVTGGYLQPATVASEDRWKLAQLAPGDRVRFYSP